MLKMHSLWLKKAWTCLGIDPFVVDDKLLEGN